MRNETLAIHAGYEPDPTTKSVAVPIYQTAAYAFDSADHGAALFNLEVDGFRYSRINTPTAAALAKRVTALGGRVAVRPGGSVLCARQCRGWRRQYRRDVAALRHHPYASGASFAALGHPRQI